MLEPRGCTVWEILADMDTDTSHSCLDGCYESSKQSKKTYVSSGAKRQGDTQEHAYASGKKWNEDNNIKLLVVAKKKCERGLKWTRVEEQVLLSLQESTFTFRVEWDTLVKNPELAGRTVNQIKSKWKNMCARGLNNRIQRRHPRWTKEEEQPLLDLLKQSTRTTGRRTGIDWDCIAKCPALANRTVEQVKEKWKAVKRKGGANVHGIRSAHWSPEEDARVMEFYERISTEAGSVTSVADKIRLVAKAFPGRAQTAVQWRCYALLRKQDAKKEAEAASLVTTQRNANTTDATAAVIHKGEIVQQRLDIKRPSKGLINHRARERARSCGDGGVDNVHGASDQYAANRAADSAVRFAKKRRLHIMMDHDPHNCSCISEQASSHKVETVADAATGSSTSTSPSSFKRSSNQQTPPRQGEVKTRPTSWMASKCDQYHSSTWASLCPKLNEEKFNAIISIYWPLFDD
jgi:uncharacterized protein YihD (DUF1040 family)